VATTRRTDLYDHKNPPRVKTPPEAGILCPMTRKRCLVDHCMLWDDEVDTCALHPANLYNKAREAVTDAVVVVMQSYKEAPHG